MFVQVFYHLFVKGVGHRDGRLSPVPPDWPDAKAPPSDLRCGFK